MSEYTHAYVQYYLGREMDLVETSQFVSGKVQEGRKAKVKWFNSQTKKYEIHDAHIHFLGDISWWRYHTCN